MHMPRLLPIVLAPIALAAHLRLIIPSSTALSNPNVLPPSTSATLTTLSQVLNSPLRADNVFDFRNISSGSYLLDIHCHTHSFAPLRVDVYEGLKLENGQARDVEEIEVFGTFRGNEWSNKGPVVDVTEVSDEGDKRIWGFMVKGQGEKEYLMERSGFSPLSLLKNPMILIAGVSMIVVFGMPYLMDNMDPELRAEFEERQKTSPLSGGQAANPLQNFDAAAWLAGSGSGSSSKRSGTPVPLERGISR